MMRWCLGVVVAGLVAVPVMAQEADPEVGTVVRFETSAGQIDVELFDERTPGTVKNFLRLVDEKAYDGSFFHRLVPGFVIQGGGFKAVEDDEGQLTVDEVKDHGPVKNEPGLENVKGTIAMAKLGGDPDSATNQFFFSLGDNRENLDNQNGGFTVFGRVIAEDFEVLDRMNGLQPVNAGGPFSSLPLMELPEEPVLGPEVMVMIDSIRVVDPDAEEAAEGEADAGSDG
ncbi:peptidylprolyl isomerase [Mucisphaera sp.]|uniref:peptidylprolyl isomerase n=1 Tax=Mucisphaera sp. TaxID=2913024 RepID=UPI003D10679D